MNISDIDPLDYQGMIQTACSAYCTQYNNKFGTYPHTGKKDTHKAYKQIIKLCVGHNIEINDYIATCFHLIEKERRYITPTDFAKAEFIQRYKDFKDKTKATLSEYNFYMECKLLSKVLKTSSNIYPDDVSILIDIGTPFSAWFRVLYPNPFNEKLFKYYGELAWKELQSNKALRIYLRKLRGEQLRQLESRIAFFGDGRMI